MPACRAHRWPDSVSRRFGHELAGSISPTKWLGEVRAQLRVDLVRESGHPVRVHESNWRRAARDSFNCWVTISPSKLPFQGSLLSLRSNRFCHSHRTRRIRFPSISCRYDRPFPSSHPTSRALYGLVNNLFVWKRKRGSLSFPLSWEVSQVNRVREVYATVRTSLTRHICPSSINKR